MTRSAFPGGLLLVLLAATALADTTSQMRILDNGLVVVVEEQARTDEVALYLKVRVGSRDEADGEHGCAHLFEHLMFEGSANVPTNAFDTWLTAAGGANNAWTSDDETVYHMTFPSGALDLALFLESDRLGFLDAGLDAGNLANQQDVVLQEREQGYARPHGRDFDALTRLLWSPGHPYHVPVIGTVADIRGFTLEAVEGFWRRHYRPRNAALVVVGNVNAEDVFAKVSHWFGDVPDTGAPAPRRAAPTHAHTARHGVIEDAVEDRTAYLAWPTVPATHPDAQALEVLSWVLDGGRGTRLQDALYYRRSLATDVSAWSMTGELAGQFVVSATAQDKPLDKVVARIDAELARVARKPPTQAEVDRARRAVVAGLEDMLETPAARAELLLTCLERRGDPNCLDDELARFAAVTPADISRVAAAWLAPASRVTLSVVPPGDDGALPGAIPVELP